MHQEYLDVVDALDSVIDRQTRSEIHRLGLRHRAVHILVFNEHARVFLQKRSMQKDLNRGLWDTTAAGHVDSGESYVSCAPRELAEELGIEATLEPLFKLQATPELGMEFIQVFRCQHNGPFNLSPDEIDEGIWQELEELDSRVKADDQTLTRTFKVILQRFRNI